MIYADRKTGIIVQGATGQQGSFPPEIDERVCKGMWWCWCPRRRDAG